MSEEPFFPLTCHPPLTRRQFLAGGVGALATPVLGGAGPAHASDAPAIIASYATLPEDPWAVAHGLRAMGSTFAIKGGQRAVDFLLEKVTEVTVNGRTILAFPLEVEIHPNSFLKTMLEAGIPLDYRFKHGGRHHTIADLVEGARLLFRPTEMAHPNQLPWSLIALSRTTPPVRRRWTNAWGEQIDLDAWVNGAVQSLESASAPIADAMRAGRPLAGKAPIHNYTCGGTHRLYSLLSAVHYGFGAKEARDRVQEQTAVMIWRMGGVEADLIGRFYAALPRSPLNQWEERDAKLKTIGHAEECVAFATARGIMTLTANQRAQRAAGVKLLMRLLAEVRRRDLGAVRAMSLQTYQQLVSDTCHAQHGLTLTGRS
jgi:L-amino acid N-acyltransferase YncA